MTTFIAWGNIHQFYPFHLIPQEYIPSNLKNLSHVDNNPTSSMRVKQRYQCRRLAHFLLWSLVKKAQLPTALLGDIYRTQTGRPQFPVKHIDFNMSHSADWVAVILNVSEDTHSAVGIDIEAPQKKRNFSALLRHFAAKNEQDWFAQQSNPERAFYEIWCSRETLLKSQGVGIVKLSEVYQDPISQRLSSIHCPQGRLVFTHELPFYFSAFAKGDSLCRAQYFHWHNEVLCSVSLQSAVEYLVNF